MKRILMITTLAAVLLSCTKKNIEMIYTAQETRIESFVSSQLKSNPDMKVIYNDGSVRLVLNEGEGVELNARGRTSIFYAGYDFSGGSISSSKMFATNNYETAVSSGWELSDMTAYEPLYIDMTDDNIIKGLRAGLAGVREGEECYILFTGRHAFGKDKNGTIPANSPLAFRVWVKSIEN